MKRLVEKIMIRRDAPYSPLEAFLWWEKGRFLYNAALLLAGLVSLLGLAGLEMISGREFPHMPDPPMIAVLLYAIAANVFYTAGEIVEVLSIAYERKDMGRCAEKCFYYGLLFSIGLTLLPFVAAVFYYVAKAV